MRHARIQQAKPERSFAERIVAVIVAIAMLGGMGYATTSAAMAADAEQTTEQQAGISLGLYDYNRDTINNNHALKFKNVDGSKPYSTYNKYVGNNNGAYTGIVNKTLTGDYPTMADGKGSLDYLFGGKLDDSVVTNHETDGGLLTLGKDGYYSFNADSQYAAYDTTSNKFNLSSRSCVNQTDTPCFTPFGNDTDENRYSFGMKLGADFYMPKGGMVNNQPMVFNFTGDDDVWVFIDGVLVLDLGGIHQALDGSIDFAADNGKGNIDYHGKQQNYGNPPPATSIDQAFRAAGKTWDPTAYKRHHLSFFYLERGDGGSNCKIRFNLPVRPSKAIDIEKETLGTIDAKKQLQFQLFVNGSLTPYQGKYSVYDASTNQPLFDNKQTIDNGVITLAKGQFARVQSDDFTDSTVYKVRELNSSGYTVSANGSPMTQYGHDDNAYAETGSFTVGTTGHVTIVNSNVKPSNNKSIVKTDGGDGDEYTLHLTASGDSSSSTVTTAVPADIVLVLDKSGSMGGSLDTNAKNAATALAQKLLTGANNTLSPNQQVRMAVVTFSKEAQTTSNFTTSSDAISRAVSAAPDGGTNWEDALRTANSLSSGRDGVQKHIVFLSDGNPTFRSTSYSGCFARGKEHPEYKTQAACEANNKWWEPIPPYQWKTDPDGSDGNIHGNGSDDGYGYNYAAALAAANERGNAALYVVKVSKDANKMSYLAKDANAVTGEEYDGTSAENLTNAFEQIYNTITTTAKIRAYSITDALSQWVDPVDFANAVDGTDITKYVTATNNGAAISGYTALYHVDGNGNRTITVTFNNDDGMIVGKNETIDVSFKVKPNDAAYADYATKQQYPNIGEADTGKESAGKQGYFSNAEAHLKYCVVTSVNDQESECTQQTLDYAKPVVQVKLGQITINKVWSDDAKKHAGDTVKVQLQRTKTDDATARTEEVGAPITLNKSNNWTDTVGNLQPGYTYSVAEISKNSRYVVSYQYGNAAADATGVALTKAMVWQSDGNGGNMTATLTNTLKTTTLSNAITVQKILKGRDWKAGDSFDFELTADDNAPLPADCAPRQPCKVTVAYKADSSDSQHSATFGDITYNAGKADYKYTITESKGNIAALHYSGAKYQIVVAVDEKDGIWTASVKSVTKLVDDNGENVSDSQKTDNPIAFTNTYVAVSALPLTGGMTDRQWLFVGGVVGGLAVLLIGAAGVWNGKKRLV